MGTDQEIPGDIYPELIAANAELSRACERHAAKAEQWHRRALEQERELAAAHVLLREQARLIEELTQAQDNLAGARLDDARAVAGMLRDFDQAERDRDAALDVAGDSARECARLRASEERLTVQLTQARSANARLQSMLEPARLRAWALYEGQMKEASE